MQRKRAVVFAIVVLVGVAGAYGLYEGLPYKRQDGQAAAYERSVRADVASVGDVRVVSGEHRVTAGEGNGDSWAV